MFWAARLSCLVLTSLCTVEILYRIGSSDEEWNIKLFCREKYAAAILCAVHAADIAWRQGATPVAVQCLFCVLMGCLLMACVMDLREHAVYRFVWWAAGGAACLMLLWRAAEGWSGESGGADIGGLLLYVLIQQHLFGRLYGRADCHAFCVCAVVQTAMGGEFQDYILQMTAAFLGLALIQGIRKNIAADGNLKEPVPFLPYITASFWLWVDFMAGKWYI